MLYQIYCSSNDDDDNGSYGGGSGYDDDDDDCDVKKESCFNDDEMHVSNRSSIG